MRGPVVTVGLLALKGFWPKLLTAQRSAAMPIRPPKSATLTTVAASLPPRRDVDFGCAGGGVDGVPADCELDGVSGNICSITSVSLGSGQCRVVTYRVSPTLVNPRAIDR